MCGESKTLGNEYCGASPPACRATQDSLSSRVADLTGLRTRRKYVDSVALVYLVNLDMGGDQRNLERKMENNMALTHNQSNSSEASISNAAGSLAALERHYSVADLAKLWLFSESTVRRIFLREPGVLKLVHEETRFKRRYTSIRIPEHVAKKVHRRLQGSSSIMATDLPARRLPSGSVPEDKSLSFSA